MLNITFENPFYLWYLLSLPLLFYTHFYALRHAKSKAIKFANFEALKRVTKDKLITNNWIILILRITILLSIIIAASGTTIWYTGNVNENDYILAIDVSASMAAEDIEPNRLEAAKQLSKEFINNIKSQSSMGIIGFSSTTIIETTQINNKDTLKKTIDNIEIAKTGGTDLAGAIITGTNMLLASEKGKSIILITDGSNTVSGFLEDSVENAIEYALDNQVIIHALGIGSEQGPLGYLPQYYNISSVYNENSLIQITNSTGGIYIQANNAQQIKDAQQLLSDASDEGFIPIKLSFAMMVLALMLLFIEWGLINTRFRKIP